ncbi:unnamed protein product [Macrosiphum euphorbiae]|uniref:CCHC-type domain-containing protein n=1 Tax=Macrosiphum euphorbiae TaxID=13131 RepID=A0AAV0WQQ3_9HEMI|nr:unnamed protein product [Macrosiphum euphorbiae]
MPKDTVSHHYNGRGMRVYNVPVYHNAVPVRRSGGNARRCYRCQQVGHLARNCDSPSVVPAASSGASSSVVRPRQGPQQQQLCFKYFQIVTFNYFFNCYLVSCILFYLYCYLGRL